MVNNFNVEKYKEKLIRNLVRVYNMDKAEAENALNQSTVNDMLNRSRESAVWQANQPLLCNLKEIYDEYRVGEMMVTAFATEEANKEIVKGVESLMENEKLDLEAACKKALSYTPRPTYKNVLEILKSGLDKDKTQKPESQPQTYGLVRGADYYGGKDTE